MVRKVSVLVTFYNQEKYVDRALNSIIEQKADFGVKILVGDDGSLDRTQEFVREWMERYPGLIELYVMDRPQGRYISGFRASANRLSLLQYVDTEYFIYLDGDDYFDCPDKLQRQVEILDAPENQDCVACAHNIDMLYPGRGREAVVSAEVKEGKISPSEYWGKLYFHTDTLLIRSRIIPSIDKKKVENNFNDNLITFLAIQQGNIYYIPESWAVYVQTGDGIWTKGNVVVNHLRNMFLYDLCNQINPEMRKETKRRFASTWMSLFRIRKQIDPAQLQKYDAEARDKKLVNSYNWIHYRDLGWRQKQKLCVKVFCISWKLMVSMILSKVCRSLPFQRKEEK